MTYEAKLDQAIKAVCPIDGVSIGRKDDKLTWRIDFKPEATAQQLTNAQAVVDAFDVAAAEAPPTADEREADALAALNGEAQRIDLQKLIKAKAISDEAYRLGVAPGALTGTQLTNLRARIAAIYKAL